MLADLKDLWGELNRVSREPTLLGFLMAFALSRMAWALWFFALGMYVGQRTG